MLICKYKYFETTIGICKIDENVEKLASLLSIKNIELVTSKVKSPSKIKEKLAIRVLLKGILQKEVFLEYNSSGKPRIADNLIDISISHTNGYAAVILSKNQKTGIDIERISDKITRIESKFINDKEFIDPTNKIIHLLIHWCAKESVYKAVSSEGVNLKDDIVVDQFIPSNNGTITVHCKSEYFHIYYEVFAEYVLAVATSQK